MLLNCAYDFINEFEIHAKQLISLPCIHLSNPKYAHPTSEAQLGEVRLGGAVGGRGGERRASLRRHEAERDEDGQSSASRARPMFSNLKHHKTRFQNVSSEDRSY